MSKEVTDAAAKRIKLDHCLICNKESHITDGKEVYTKLLVNYLVPPLLRNDAILFAKAFNYCVDCVELLEDLCQLKEGLDFILKSIKSKVEAIKFCILKNGASSDVSIERFRKVAVSEYIPTVRMGKDNALLTKANHKVKEGTQTVRYKIRSKEPTKENIEKDLDTNMEIEEPSHKEDSTLKIVPVPKPFPKTVDDINVSIISRSEGEKSISNRIEDAIIVVTEPPKFDKAQSHIYFENYKDMYKCKFCSMIIKGENNQTPLSRHINVVHAKNSRFKCSICFAIFFAKTKCRSHISETHFETEEDSVDFTPAPVKISEKGDSGLKSLAKKKITLIDRIPMGTHYKLPEKEIEKLPNSSSGGKYSDDKIRSGIVINIEAESPYNLLEDIVKFEPWDETSMDITEESVDPLEEKPSEETSFEFQESISGKNKQQTLATEIKERAMKVWKKPKLNFIQLAVLAIKNSKTSDSFLSFSSICEYIKTQFPWFESDTSKWQVSLKHALATACFKSVQDATERRYAVIENKILQMKYAFNEACTSSVESMANPEQLDSIVSNAFSETIASEKRLSLSRSLDEADPKFVNHVIEIAKPENTAAKIIRTEEIRPVDKIRDAGNESSNDSSSSCTAPSEHNYLKRCLNPDKMEYGRPPYTYTHLSFLAINSSTSKSLKISEIHSFIKDMFPFFCTYQANWKNSLYLCLKTNECFKLIKIDAVNNRQARLPSRFAWTVANSGETSIINIKIEVKNILLSSTRSIFEAIGNHENLETVIRRAIGDDVDYNYVQKERESYLMNQSRQNTKKSNTVEKDTASSSSPAEVIWNSPKSSVVTVLPNTSGEDIIRSRLQVQTTTKPTPSPTMAIFTPLPLYNMFIPIPLTSFKQEKIWAKPNITYEVLCVMAIKNSNKDDKFLCLSEILEFIREHFPWFRVQEKTNLDSPWVKDVVQALSSPYFTWKLELGIYSLVKNEESQANLERHFAVAEGALPEIKEAIREILRENVETMAHPEILDRIAENVIFSSSTLYQDDDEPDFQIVSAESLRKPACKEEIDEIEIQYEEPRSLPLTFLAPLGTQRVTK